MWQDGRLRATYKDGRARLNAYLDDHAFVIEGLLALLEARWHDGNLRFAIELAEALLARFEDPAEGGFFFTSHDHEALLLRSKSLADDALPSGAGIAAYALG
ncbi:MAG: thioredoxin domain-containing protein, partial [Gammaproteobacteria bacterium]